MLFRSSTATSPASSVRTLPALAPQIFFTMDVGSIFLLISLGVGVAVLVTMLDGGRGRLGEAVEALRWEDEGMMKGLGALHVAASRGSLEVCRYLLEDLGVDVDAVDGEGHISIRNRPPCRIYLCFFVFPSEIVVWMNCLRLGGTVLFSACLGCAS